MIHLSAGSAAALQLKTVTTDTLPTTAYLLHGDRCLASCAFCPRGQNHSPGKNIRLGRITWPLFSKELLEKPLSQAAQHGLKRICLQSVMIQDIENILIPTIYWLKGISTLPLSVSVRIETSHQADQLLEAGADNLNIALDLANESLHSRHKASSLLKKKQLLFSCADRWPGRISTHIICGLGETEEELLKLGSVLYKKNISVGLFAFTPLRGTPLETHPPPALEQYRRIQAGLYLLKEDPGLISCFQFKKGRLISCGLTDSELSEKLAGGKAFQTSGCPGCNRPYYNEKPGQTFYNYPRPLKAEEEKNALKNLKGLEQGGIGSDRKMAAHLGPTAAGTD